MNLDRRKISTSGVIDNDTEQRFSVKMHKNGEESHEVSVTRAENSFLLCVSTVL